MPSRCPTTSSSGEPLPSALDNFIRHFFGTLTRHTGPNGRVTWELPDDLNAPEPVAGHPRADGEGLATYFLRVVNTLHTEGIQGFQGEPGSPGSPGAPGQHAFSFTTAAFEQPSIGDTVEIHLASAGWVAEGHVILVSGAGHYRVHGVSGTTIHVENLGYPGSLPAGTMLDGGNVVSPAGYRGLTGADGAKGEKGDKGEPGDQGEPGPARNGYGYTTADFEHPAAGQTVTVQVDSNAWMAQGLTIFVAGQLYQVVSIAGEHSVLLRANSPSNAVGHVAYANTLIAPAGVPGPQGPGGSVVLTTIIQERQEAGVNAGKAPAKLEWFPRNLNYIAHDDMELTTIEDGVITLPPGEWDVEIQCPGHDVESHRARLVQIGGEEAVYYGTSARCGYYATTNSDIRARISADTPTQWQLEHQCGDSKGATDLGVAANFGTEHEVYAQAVFRFIGGFEDF